MAARRVDVLPRPPYQPSDRNVNAEAVRSTLLAELALQAGDVPAAVVAWRSAAHADDTSPYLRVRLGEALLLVGDVEGAVVAADTAIALGKDGKDDARERDHVLAGWRLRSLGLAADGDRAGAIAALRAALALSPGEPRASALLAEHLVAAGELDGAEAVVAAWMKDAADVRGTVQLAKVFADRRQVDRAFRLLDTALTRLPDDENALGTRRDLLLALGRYDEAAQAARGLLAAIGDAAASRGSVITTLALSAPAEARALAASLLAADDSERSQLIVASAFEAAGLVDDAVAALSSSSSSSSSSAGSLLLRLERARLALVRGDAAPGLALCEVVIAGSDARYDDHRLFICAQALADSGDVDGALARLLASSPVTRPRVLNKLTILVPQVSPAQRVRLVAVAEAALTAGRAHAVDDDVVVAACGLLAAADDRRTDEAIALLDTVIARRPGRTSAQTAKLRLQTTAFASSDEVLTAVAAFEQRQRRKDDGVDVDSLNFMAFTLAERGLRSADASTFAWRALLRDPTNGYITDTLGWAQLKDGAVDDAIATLRRADRLAPREAEIWFHIAVAEARRGDSERAQDAIARAAGYVVGGDPLKVRIDVVAAALASGSALPSSP